MPQQPVDLSSLTLSQLNAFVAGLQEPSYRAGQIARWLARGVTSFEEMSDLPAALRGKLLREASLTRLIVLRESRSSDGTVKYLFELSDGQTIESVVMEYHHGTTICISTQAGCRMGCRFCASTIGGKVRDLTPGEMLGQVLEAGRRHAGRISNVVLMGIGEPLDNFDNVMTFLTLLGDEKRGPGIGQRHISLSTCGLCDRIDELADRKLGITLSISLHAPNDAIREKIMPISRSCPMDHLLVSCRRYIEKTGRRVCFEYALIKGLNDSPFCAEELASRLHGMQCHVNLIPINEVQEAGFYPTDRAGISQFVAILEQRHISVTVRRTLGSDIAASCGQLRRANREEGEPR